MFVYGQAAFNESAPAPVKYPARQTLEASRAIARLHGLGDRHAVFAQQNPAAIDAGVFHNDVIAVGNGSCLFYHELAFLDEGGVLSDIRARLAEPSCNRCGSQRQRCRLKMPWRLTCSTASC